MRYLEYYKTKALCNCIVGFKIEGRVIVAGFKFKVCEYSVNVTT